MAAMRHVTVRLRPAMLKAIDLAVRAQERRQDAYVSRNYWIVKALREALRSKRDG